MPSRDKRSGPFRYHPHLGYASDAARLDALIEDSELRAAGVLEDDQPTDYSHRAWMAQWESRVYGEFTARERGEIRSLLGLAPEDSA